VAGVAAASGHRRAVLSPSTPIGENPTRPHATRANIDMHQTRILTIVAKLAAPHKRSTDSRGLMFRALRSPSQLMLTDP
jgi:hypothetical protein